MYRPFADKYRPTTLENVVGQRHILGKNGVLSRICSSGNIPNMIFYGPSGTGKTTVAQIIANSTNRTLHKLNATNASISDIKDIISSLDTFMAPNGVLLYLDEIQYFNKKQQQSLLEFIESGKITLIASTTENPYFYVFNAILSRSTVFEFKPVEKEDISLAIERVIKQIEEDDNISLSIEDGVIDHIAVSCGGDVRKAINSVELLYLSLSGGTKITLEDAKSVAQRSSNRYDRDGDVHYDLLSAFHKSVRGSDPDAAIYYLARLLSAGDILSPARRLLCIANEDIGLAYPMAAVITKACVDSALQLGLPEAQLPLANATIMLATAPKSNTASSAIGQAMSDVSHGKVYSPPPHLQDAHYSGASKLGRGLTYQYPHNFPNNYITQQYLPDELKSVSYYEYGNNKTEQAAKAYWDKIKK
ncbi:MAG: replication-associated recombination protein A [Ruminococcaceae bacterium]|nr:replication-associated recombination protein A [Oscillospiraceae bacterium]